MTSVPTTVVAVLPTPELWCADCGMRVCSEAEAFLHASLHAEPFDWQGTLYQLPYNLFPRIARLLEEYKRSV